MSHNHRYSRINLGRNGKEYWVMKCNLPGCNHYTPGKTKLSFPTLRGQVALCNKCNEKFELNKRALRFAKPVCDECVVKKNVKELKAADEFFDDLLKDVKNGTNS